MKNKESQEKGGEGFPLSLDRQRTAAKLKLLPVSAGLCTCDAKDYVYAAIACTA